MSVPPTYRFPSAVAGRRRRRHRPIHRGSLAARAVSTAVDRPDLAADLVAAFDADEDAARVVARAAGDLADAGRYEADVGAPLGSDLIVSELRDAPAEHDLRERWNWWIGSLELSFGGYERFLVRQ